MEEFLEVIKTITEIKTLFILCGIFIGVDILTGYLKAFKFKKVNSSISRDGYIKKIAWAIALLLGFIIDYFVGINMFLCMSALVCVATEGISVYENLGELGIDLPFSKYFEKLRNEVKKEAE